MDTYSHPSIAANVAANERAVFIQRTYNHLAGALIAFAALCYVILQSSFAATFTNFIASNGQLAWIGVLVAYMIVSHVAESWARSSTSLQTQYAGLAVYIVATAVIFTPLLFAANYFYPGEQIIAKAGITTAALVAGITFVAFTSGKDFSFLGSFLRVALFVALGVIVASWIFQFSLGSIFAGIMVLIMGGCLLYDTSNVIRHYRTDQYVSASLALFASIAMMLWYIIQIFMSSGD